MPTIEMTDIDLIVRDAIRNNGLEYTYDNRIELLAYLAKNTAQFEELAPLVRIRIALMISVEIVRLRMEKQFFEK